MANKMFMFLCSSCGWKRVCPLEESGLFELKSDALSARKFRCPQCGRAMCPRASSDPQADLEMNIEEDRLRRENESFIEETEQFQKNFLNGIADG